MVTFDRNFGSKCKEHLVKARKDHWAIEGYFA